MEQAHGIGAAADAGDQRIGQPPFGGLHLLTRLAADNALKIADMENDALVPIATTNLNLGALFVGKYTGDGAKVWVKQIGGGGLNFATTASMLDDGSLIVAGGFSASGVYDGWILQNPEGGGLGITANAFLVRIPDR